jgi:hypothetical protein
MKPRVYIETTIPSYLTARPSGNVVLAGHQLVTREWWDLRRMDYELCASQFVLDECSAGDPDAARLRLESLHGSVILTSNEASQSLAEDLIAVGHLPPKAELDAYHIALATIHAVPYLLTWNCRHIANAHLRRRFEAVCSGRGFELPTICTPEELMEATS